VNSFKSEQQLL
jgi:DNA polymerase delta subunit 1